MTARFELHDDWAHLTKWAGVAPSSTIVEEFKGHPLDSKFHPVLRLSLRTGEREFVRMREGLIPSYACDERGAEGRSEAHAEAMTCDSCFRSAFRRRRCLIPANVLHERRHLASGIEQPCSFALESGALFAIAGVWETWTNDQGHAIESFAMVTALVTPVLRTLFDRMPVVLMRREDQERWLHASTDHDHPPLELMRPLSVSELREWKLTPGSIDLHLEPVAPTAHALTSVA
jgi:putative SOS response-associated peptidase YedK